MTHKFVVDNEFKQLIPPLSEEEYQQLKTNILAKRKCLNPILLWDGIVVDGHNRFYICLEHGIEFEVKDMHFDSREQAKLWILENQLGRRNLTDAARIELALCKEELLRALAKERQKLGGQLKGELFTKSPTENGTPINVHKTIAEESGVGHGTLQRYEAIKKEGPPGLLEKVKNGEMKIGTAYRMLPSQLPKQFKEVEDTFEYIDKHLHLIKSDIMKDDINNRLLAIKSQLLEFQERRKSQDVKK